MICEWSRRFRNGEINVLEEKRIGRKRKWNDVQKEEVENLLKENRKLTTKELSQITNISKTSILRILNELGIFLP